MSDRRYEAIVIGSSAGALEALSAILPMLPKAFSLPIMVVVHLPAERKSLIATLLSGKSAVPVLEAEDKLEIVPGTVYIAPPDYHLLVEPDGRLSLSVEEPVRFSRPSIDVLFETAAEAYRSSLIGVVLTGANSDGTQGLRAVIDAGGLGIVQRPDISYASFMPESAIAACPEAVSLSLQEIAPYLVALVGTERP